MPDKKKQKNINVRDMKPKKDAKGGGHQISRPGRGDSPVSTKGPGHGLDKVVGP